jgi:hypothetical protein
MLAMYHHSGSHSLAGSKNKRRKLVGPIVTVWVVQAGLPTYAVQAVFVDEAEARELAEKNGWIVGSFPVAGNLIAQYLSNLNLARGRHANFTI